MENNSISLGVTTKNVSKVELRRTNNNPDQTSSFEVISRESIDGEIFIKNTVEGIPAIYYKNNGVLEEINSEIKEGYIVAKINKVGEYALGAKSCSLIYEPSSILNSSLEKTENATNVVFVPFDYSDLNLFNSKLEFYKNKLIERNPNLKIYKIAKNSLSCLNLNQCDISMIDTVVQSCDAYIDYNLGLVGNSLVGSNVIRRGNTILVGSFSTTQSCENCEQIFSTIFAFSE